MLAGLLKYFALAFLGVFSSFATVEECVIQGLNALEQGSLPTASQSRWQRVLSGKSSTSKLDDLALAPAGEQTDEGLQALADYYGVPKKELLVPGSPPQLNRSWIWNRGLDE